MSYVHPWHGETVQGTSPGLLRRAIAASALGNATEWFDYGIYAYGLTYISAALFPSPLSPFRFWSAHSGDYSGGRSVTAWVASTCLR
jgi:hypothetical protein